MKNFRLFAALLVVALLSAPAFPEDSSEIAALEAKARKGNGIAQYNLGLAYAEGKGVAADPVEAYVWLSLARENGARGRALDNLTGELDRISLELAQRRLAERKTELNSSRPPAPVRRPAPIPVAKAKEPAPQPAPPPEQPAPAAPPTADAPADSVELAALRADRERLANLVAQHEKTTRDAEAKVIDLTRTADATKGELARVRMALTAAQKITLKPAAPATPSYPDLSGRVAELEAANTALSSETARAKQEAAALAAKPSAPAFPDLRSRVTELETQVAADSSALTSAKAEAARAKQEAAALTQAKDDASTSLVRVQAALAARSAAPSYPDLSGKVSELQAQLAAAKSAAPAYPNLSGRVTELEAALAHASSEANRAKQDLAAATKAKEEANAALRARPATTDTAATDQKTRELQAALAELEEARTFGRKVEDALNKVNDDKTRVAAAAAAELAEARTFGTQVESTLNKVSDQKAALETALRAAEAARDSYAAEFATARAQLAAAKPVAPAAPVYPDLSSKVADLESKLAAAATQAASARQEMAALSKAKDDAQAALAAKPVAPVYPDLRDRVAQLEREVAAKPAAPAYPNLSGKVTELETALAAQSSDATRAKQEVATLAKARDDAQAALAAKPVAPVYPDLRDRVAQLEREVAAKPAAPAYPDLSAKVAELEAARAAQSTETTRAKQEVAALTKARDDAQAALAAKPAPPAYPNLSGRVAELESSLAASAQKTAAAEQGRTEVAKQFDEFKSSTTAAQRERTTLLASVKLLESDKVSLRRQAEKSGAETDQLRTQVASLKEQLSAKPAAPGYPNLSGKVAELETALVAAKAAAPAYPDLRSRVSGLEAELATAQKGLAARPAAPAYPDLRDRVAQLEREVVAKPAAPAYPDLSAKVGELETALSQAKSSAPAYPDVRGRVTELETQLTNLSAALSVAVAGKAEATAQVAELTKAGENARARTAELQTALAAKSAAPAYPDLSGRVAELESAFTATSTSLAQAQAALAARPAAPAYPDLRDRVAQLEREVAAKPAAPAYPDLSAKVAELETALTNSTRQIATAATEADRAKREVAQLTRTIAETPKTAPAPAYPDYSNLVKEMMAEVTKLRADHAHLQQALTAAERQSGDLSAEAARAKQEVAALLKAKEDKPAAPDLSGRVTELQTALADSARKLVAADTTQADLRQQLAASENASKIKGDYVTELEGKLRKQVAAGKADPQLAREHQELTSRVATLSGEVTQLRDDRERMQKLIADSGRRQRDSTADASRIKELETQLAANQTALSAAKLETSQASAQTAELQAALAAKPAAPAYPDVRGQITDLKGQLSALSAEAEHTKQQLAASTKATEMAQARVNSLETQLADASKQRNPAYPDLSGRVAELETRLTRQATDLAAAGKQVATLSKAAKEVRSEPISAGSPTFPNLSLRVRELEGQLSTATADAQRRGQQLTDLTRSSETTQRNLTRELEAAKSALAKPAAGPAYPDLRPRVTELESRLATTEKSLAAKPAAPTYPDLSARVAELETRQSRLTADLSAATSAKTAAEEQIAALAAKPSAPAYPDLRSRVAELEAQARDARPATPVYPDLRTRVAQLESDLATARNARPAAPAYPDLRSQVTDLRGQLSALGAEDARTKQQLAALTRTREESRQPAYPDLRSRVAELEGQLAQAASQPVAVAPAPVADDSDLQKRLADTEDRLATALRGYALLEKDRDALQANTGRTTDTLNTQVATLTAQANTTQEAVAATQAENARLSASLAALQRSSGQAAGDAASARTLVQQLQGANAVLAQENYQLKTTLSRTTGGPAPVATTALAPVPAARMHVVASGDTLSRLSQRYYGTAGRWQEIYNANSGVLGPNGVLRIGTSLRIP